MHVFLRSHFPFDAAPVWHATSCKADTLPIAHSLINRNGERVQALKKTFCGKKKKKKSARKGLPNERE